MKKFTFKKDVATGRYRSFELASTTIKFDNKEVGSISELGGIGYKGNDMGKFKISLMVKKEPLEAAKSNCDWKNITFKHIFETEPAAREWLISNCEKIQKSLKLRYL